jgi:hypothetical protein
MEDGCVGLVRKRLIEKFHQDSRSEQENDQYNGHTAETPCQGEFERSFLDVSGTKMKDEAVEKPSIVCPVL